MSPMNLLRMEFDIHHIAVLSRKVPEEHALVRLILSALATPEELENLVKRDLRIVQRDGLSYYTVKLTAGGKSRISPIDAKTYDAVMNICREKSGKQRVFDFSRAEMDEIIKKYSPQDRKYNVKKLREAVIEILKDNMLLGDNGYIDDLLAGTNFENVVDFLYDFHPMYSGMWDMDDDDVAEDFVLTYSEMTGIKDAEKLAEIIGENVERIEKFLSSKRSGFNFRKI